MYVTFSLLGEKGEGVVFSRPLRALRALSLCTYFKLTGRKGRGVSLSVYVALTNIRHSRLSFVSHHAERISIASVKGVNRAILDRRAKLASELSRRA